MRCARVVLLVALCWGVASAEPAAEDPADADMCAMTEVLVAMKKLLLLLSTEVRDLRDQVKKSCQASGTTAPNTTVSPITVTEPIEKQEPAGSDEATAEPEPSPAETEDDDDLGDEFTIELEKDEKEEEDYDYTNPEENPVSEVIEGMTKWWKSFSLFPPKPTTTDATPTDEPEDADEEGLEEDYEAEEHVDMDEDEDADILTTKAPKRTTSTSTTTTTTTTTPRPYTVPPPPTSCPSPFTLLAEGCYLMVHNARDWRSWGEAYAFCQSYGGRLASPWRLEQLQDYLIRYYSDAFWVGARLIPSRRRWEWLTGRRIEQGEWKPGQPNRNPGKKCVFLDKWSGYHANNFFCGEKYPFICESMQG